jgi:hypothetical protein
MGCCSTNKLVEQQPIFFTQKPLISTNDQGHSCKGPVFIKKKGRDAN